MKSSGELNARLSRYFTVFAVLIYLKYEKNKQMQLKCCTDFNKLLTAILRDRNFFLRDRNSFCYKV